MRNPRRPAWRDASGQTFVFVLTSLFTLFLIVGVSMNVGQAVNRRIMLQIAADAGAFTGASEMARGLNTIARLNRRIQRAWGGMTIATAGFTFPPCSASDLGTRAYGVARWNLGQLIRLVNIGYGLRAASEARRITEYNGLDMFPFEQLQMGESDSQSGIGPQRPLSQLVDLLEVEDGTWPNALALAAGSRNRRWLCWGGFPPVSTRSQSFDLWYRADSDRMPISFAWVVKAPARSARVFDAFFGPRAIPEMAAAAVAKPVGGDIRLGRDTYVVKMMPVRQIRPSVYDWRLRRSFSVFH